MRVVSSMTQQPGTCVACGGAPTDIDDNPIEPIIDLDVDVNWGDTAYLCGECVKLIGDLAGRPSQEKFDATKEELKVAKRQIKSLKKRLTEQSDRVRKVVDGKRAEKKLKEAV